MDDGTILCIAGLVGVALIALYNLWAVYDR